MALAPSGSSRLSQELLENNTGLEIEVFQIKEYLEGDGVRIELVDGVLFAKLIVENGIRPS